MIKITTLDNVIKEVKEMRTDKDCPWIFENGEVRKDVFVGDVIPFLEEMKRFEMRLSQEEFEALFSKCDIADNTYNGNCNISNDIDYRIIKGEDTIKVLFMVHLFGDVRGNYTDWVVVEVDSLDKFFGADTAYQTKEITDTMVADINIFSEEYGVFDTEMGEIGYFSDIEKEDLLDSINEAIE